MLASKALAAAVSQEPAYIEDVFSTYLYTGTGSAQTITNGIDLSGEGGLVWTKSRSNAIGHALVDTANGVGTYLRSDSTAALRTDSYAQEGVTSFNADGYSLGNWVNEDRFNRTSWTYASWTFRKQAKFFDVVTYTGNGVVRTIPHNLGSVPGCIIIKSISNTSNWEVYHRGLSATNQIIRLNTTGAETTALGAFNGTAPTSTEFTLGGASTTTNVSGYTYVAYLFAHDAGGFGLSGSDNVISCGSWTGANQVITLGYEPQFILWKRTDTTGDWYIVDNMRGLPVGASDKTLYPNLSNSESTEYVIDPTATGFIHNSGASGTYIYIAIRRGPMKVPTSGTSVYNGVLVNSSASTQSVDAGWPVDLVIKDYRNLVNGAMWFDRLRGITSSTNPRLLSATTGAEVNSADINGAYQAGVTEVGIGTGYTSVDWFFRRAPGFFDVVCYTGNGVARTVNHNLGVAPELMIVKSRSAVSNWRTYNATDGNTKYMNLQDIDASVVDSTNWNNTSPTSSVFTVGTNSNVNASGGNFVAYLFATVAGVSKVGSYTGSGTTKQIDCGFTAGARFVLIKRTDSTGSWYCWDSARGIVAGNDPYLLLNSTAAEVTGTDYIDTYSAGFEITSTAPAEINASGGTFVFLSIA